MITILALKRYQLPLDPRGTFAPQPFNNLPWGHPWCYMFCFVLYVYLFVCFVLFFLLLSPKVPKIILQKCDPDEFHKDCESRRPISIKTEPDNTEVKKELPDIIKTEPTCDKENVPGTSERDDDISDSDDSTDDEVKWWKIEN